MKRFFILAFQTFDPPEDTETKHRRQCDKLSRAFQTFDPPEDTETSFFFRNPEYIYPLSKPSIPRGYRNAVLPITVTL